MKQVVVRNNSYPNSIPPPPAVDVERAEQIWAEYQKQHDITPFLDQTAGIDPVSGRIWFGESGLDVRKKMHDEGVDTPIYCVRVGQDYYVRKGSHE